MNKKPNKVLDNVEGFCGPYPSDFIDIDISNDPSFIFQNDTEYDAVTLYDSDGNSVSVNSFFVFSLLSIFIGYIAIKKFFLRGII